MLEEKIHYQTDKMKNNESSESVRTGEETSNCSKWQNMRDTTYSLRYFSVAPSKARTWLATGNNF